MRRTFKSRLARLEAACPEHAWQYSEGLSPLLAYAWQSPPETGALADLGTGAQPLTGLVRLLEEARRDGPGRQEEPA